MELPLGGHHFSVCSSDFYSGVETSFIVSLNDGATKDFVGSNTTVIRSCIKIILKHNYLRQSGETTKRFETKMCSSRLVPVH